MKQYKKSSFMAYTLVVIGILVFTTLLFYDGYLTHNYKRQATILAFEDSETVSCEDAQGNVWLFYTEGYDHNLKIGSTIILSMNDNSTPNNYLDDIITDYAIK